MLALLVVVAAVALGGSALGTAAAATAGTITVDDGGGADYASIQAAVDNAATGDTIEVRPGTYREEVTVDKTLTIVAPDGATLNGSTLGNYPVGISIEGQAAPEIAGLTIVNYERGVDARSSTGGWILRNLHVRNASFGAVHASETTGDWTIENSTIEDELNDAVDASDSVGDWTIRGSTLTSRVYANNASGQWTIEDVVLRDSFGEGIVARETDSAWTIQDTVVRGTGVDGISARSATGAWTIDNVTVQNTGQAGISAAFTRGDWTIRDSVVRNNSDEGISAYSASGNWSVLNSTIRNNSRGGISAANTSGSWEIHESTIVGNDPGVGASGSPDGDATRNWWGACDGPSGEFSGSGDAAAGTLTVGPFFTDAARTTLSNETSSPCGASSTFDFGVELEQSETVAQGGDVNISAYPNNRVDDPVSDTTVELLVDADADDQFESAEVAASRSVDFAASEYREVVLTYENVQLAAGQYEYMARISKDGQTARSFTNGTLTVSGGTASGCRDITTSGHHSLSRDVVNSTASYCINVTASNVVLDGQGHVVDGVGATLGSAAEPPVGVFVDGATNVTVRNLTVSDWQTAVVYRNASGRLTDLDVRHARLDGVLVDRAELAFEDGTVTADDDGFQATDDAELTVRDTTVDDGSGATALQRGLRVTSRSTAALRNVTVSNAAITGMLVNVFSSGDVVDSEFTDNEIGVELSSSSQADVVATTVSDSTADGFRVGTDSGLVLQNSSVVDTGRNAVTVDEGRALVRTVRLENFGHAGVAVTAATAASRTEIHGSNIVDADLGDDDFGVRNANRSSTAAVVNATGNYWGAADGPSSNGTSAVLQFAPFADPFTGTFANGSGTAVSMGTPARISNVHFDPFAASPISGAGDGDADGVSVTLQPAEASVPPGGTATFDVVVEGIDAGVGSYDVRVNSTNTTRATITGVQDAIGGTSETDLAPDGSTARIGSFAGGTAQTGPVTVANVTVEAGGNGTVDLPLTVASVSDEGGTQYAVGSTAGASITVEQVGPDVTGDGNPATDPDNDGLYEDVNGDSDTTPGDATVLFNAVFDGNPAVMDNVALFDFNQDDNVTPGDATVLFDEIF